MVVFFYYIIFIIYNYTTVNLAVTMNLCVCVGVWQMVLSVCVCINISTIRGTVDARSDFTIISMNMFKLPPMDLNLQLVNCIMCVLYLANIQTQSTKVLIESGLDETTSVHHLKSHFFHLRGIPTDCLEICCDEGGGCTVLCHVCWPRTCWDHHV